MVTPLAVRHWRSLAACRSADPDLFFPISSSGPAAEQVMAARAICARCQVRRQCLAFALRTRQMHGIWGGLTEQELRFLRLTGAERSAAERNGEEDAEMPAKRTLSSPA